MESTDALIWSVPSAPVSAPSAATSPASTLLPFLLLNPPPTLLRRPPRDPTPLGPPWLRPLPGPGSLSLHVGRPLRTRLGHHDRDPARRHLPA